MAAILRATLGRAAASSGLLSQLPPRRLLHAGRPNLAPQQPPERAIPASSAFDEANNVALGKSFPASQRVDQLVNKAEGVAKKEVLFEYVKRLVQEQKGGYGSPIREGSAFPWFLGVAFVAVFMAGYQVGVDQAANKQDTKNIEKATS